MIPESPVSLVDLIPGQKGIVHQIAGGPGVENKLCVMGVVPGKRITKVSQLPAGGPVVIRLDEHELALGRGVAQKIVIKVSE
ncbi:MAG: FeoA domain-containing protein [Atribacterota bacterium]